MFTRLRYLLLVPFLLLASSSLLLAAPPKWEVDHDHSGLYFSVQHIFSQVKGHFREYKGEILFDPADLEGSRIGFEVEVKSIFTDIPKRDKHLLSADFFDEGTYPLITFRSTEITKTDENLYQVIGTLTIKDVTQEVTLPLTLLGITEHPAQKGTQVAGFAGELAIDRLSFHVGNGKFADMGLVGKTVAIDIQLELLRNN